MQHISKRIVYLDVLRVLACFLVLTTHSVMPNFEDNSLWVAGIAIVCTPSSELFLTLSGAILLPVHTSFKDFYKRRFLKLLPPMVIWSIVGILLKYFTGSVEGRDAIKMFVLIPLKPVHGVYWFLYTMIGLYLFAPYISFWLREATKKQVEFFLIIWGITLCIPWLNLFQNHFYDLDGSYYWVLCYFGGFLGYWILGYYLRYYNPSIKSPFGLLVFVVSVVYPLAIIGIRIIGYDYVKYLDNLQIGSACWVSLIFMTIRSVSEKAVIKPYLHYFSTISVYSFGIYLMHPFVIHLGIWKIMEQHRFYSHPVLETLFIVITAILFCVSFIGVFSKIPKVGKYCFGLK